MFVTLAYSALACSLPGSRVPGHEIGFAVRRSLCRCVLADCGPEAAISENACLDGATAIRLLEGCSTGNGCVFNPWVPNDGRTFDGPEVEFISKSPARMIRFRGAPEGVGG